MAETKTVAPTRAQFKPLNKVDNLAELFRHPDFKERIASAAPKHFNAERLLRTMVLATQKVPKLLEVSPMQMLGACITLAALGLEPNTPLQHAHLIPFEVNQWNPATRKREYVRTDVQVIIGYQGYIDLIYRSGLVKSVHCDVYYQDELDSGAFRYHYGTHQHLHHEPSGKVRPAEEEPAGAYMYAELKGGGEVFEVMPAVKIHLARSRSQGYRAAMWAHDDAVNNNKDPKKDKRYSEAPWIKDPEAMWRKTPLRSGQKWLPKSIEMAAAVAADERAIDFSQITSGDMVLEGSFAVEEDEPATIAATAPAEVQAEVQAEAQTGAEVVVDKPKQTRAAKAAKAAPEPEKVAEPETGILYPLRNAFGEDDDGPFGPADDPVEFAKIFKTAWTNAVPESRQALAEANTDALTEAMNRSIEANTILQPFILEAKAGGAATEEPYVIPHAKTAKGTWDMVAWVNAAKALISNFTELEDFRRFGDVNAETIAKLSATATTILDNYVGDRREQLGLSEPVEDMPGLDDVLVPGDEEPAVEAVLDEWQAMFIEFKGLFERTETLSDLNDIARNVAIKSRLASLQKARPNLASELNIIYNERSAALRVKT
jgi:recombination protein RecT